LRRMAGGAADRAGSALERRNPVLQNGNRRIRQPRIDEADFLKVEKRRCVIGIAEAVRSGLIDRRLAGSGRGVRGRTGMYLERVETLSLLGHSFLPALVHLGRSRPDAKDFTAARDGLYRGRRSAEALHDTRIF